MSSRGKPALLCDSAVFVIVIADTTGINPVAR